MKNLLHIIFLFLIQVLVASQAIAQCAVCTKTAQQLGEKPALGINQGIIYLILTPFACVGVIAYRWWKTNKQNW